MEWMIIILLILFICIGAVFLYRIPIKMTFSLSRFDIGMEGYAAVGWGILSIRITKRKGSFQGEIFFHQSVLFRWEGTRDSKEKTEKDNFFTAPGIPGMFQMIRHIPGWIQMGISHIKISYASGRIRFGSGDPALTGVIYGLYRAILPLLPDNCSCELIPVFESLELTGNILFRVLILTPLDIVVIIGFQVLSCVLKEKIPSSLYKKSGAYSV